MRRLAKVIAAAGAILLGVASSVWADGEKIVLVTHGLANDPYWNLVKHGAEDAAKQLNATVEYRAPNTFNMVQMAQLIDAAVVQKPTGLIVTIPDADALGPSIKRAVASGIPTISFNSGVDAAPKLGTLIHIHMDEYVAGKIVGEKLKSADAKKILCINHEVGNTALDDRCRGVTDGFGGPVAVIPTTNDFQDVKSKVTAALSRDHDIDTIISLSAGQSGEPAVVAAAEAGRPIKVAAYDLSPGFLKDLEQGKALFAVEHQPYLESYLATIFMINYIRYGLLPVNKLIETGPKFDYPKDAAKIISLSEKAIR